MANQNDDEKQTKAQADAQANAAAAAAAAQPSIQVGAMPYEAYRSQQAVADVMQGRALQMDQTTPGGRYQTEDGRTVDADGKEIKGEKG